MQRAIAICTSCKQIPRCGTCRHKFSICPHCEGAFSCDPNEFAGKPPHRHQVNCGYCEARVEEYAIGFHDVCTDDCAECPNRRHSEKQFNCRICHGEFFNCACCNKELTKNECQFHDSGRIFCGIDCLYTIETPTFKKYTINEPYSISRYPAGYLCDIAEDIKGDIRWALDSQTALLMQMQMTENPKSLDVKLDRISKYDQLVEVYRTEVKSFHEKKIQEELAKIEDNIRELLLLNKQVFYKVEHKTSEQSLRLAKARESYNKTRLRIIDTTKTDVEILADTVQYAKQLRQQKPT